jgi:hypothetical protein
MTRPANLLRFASSAIFAIYFSSVGAVGTALAGTPIPQPQGITLNVADASKRVDLELPAFSRPTEVTNPLFPVSRQASVLFTGQVDGKPFRTEVTLLPFTRIVSWQGIQIETLVSQYVAYLDGRVEEVAYDLYAQADDGSVWYFGEDVSDFRDGWIYTKEGTWLAGKDGPPCMIMPGKPRIGDVFRAENMPGIAFEEVMVSAVDRDYNGPLGVIRGAMLGRELHEDGSYDEKTFAPGYGEVFTGSGGDIEALALAVPTDALSVPVPSELRALSDAALSAFKAASAKDWKQATDSVAGAQRAWQSVSSAALPKPIKPILNAALNSLAAAVEKRNVDKARRAAIETARWTLDLQLRHRPVSEIDLARYDLWAAQVIVDAAAGDAGSVTGDMFTLTLIRDRLLAALDPKTTQSLNIELGALMSAAADEEFGLAMEAAEKLREIVAQTKLRGMK